MNEQTWELLSRRLDGDLGPAERAELEERLRAQPDLQTELEGLRDLRGAVRALAQREEPPAELDRVLERVRSARLRRRSVRPAFGWLAAAAVVLCALTVGRELALRRPAPSIERPPAADVASSRREKGKREVVRQQPLPRAADDDRVGGASDQALASAPTQPAREQPPAAEVTGALPEGNRLSASPPEAADRMARGPGETGEERIAEQQLELGKARRAPQLLAHANGMDASDGAHAVRATGVRDCSLVIKLGERSLTVACSRSPCLAAGRYRVNLVIGGGLIHQVAAPRDEPRDEHRAHALDALLGQAVSGVDDGSYSAQLVLR